GAAQAAAQAARVAGAGGWLGRGVGGRACSFALKADHDEVTFRPGLLIPQPIRYTTRDWPDTILSWPRSPLLRRVFWPVSCFTLWSVAITGLSKVVAFPSLTLTMHSLVGTALGLLLVFRTNTANDRYWEGRRMWETVVSTSRDIAALCCSFHAHLGPAQLQRVCRLLSAFPICLAMYISGPGMKSGSRSARHMLPLARVLDSEDRALLAASCSPPSRVVQMLLRETTRIPDSADGFFTNRERSSLQALSSKLLGTVGVCERLVQTPIPQSYVRHTSRFLSLWLLTLPLGLCHNLEWWTPLVVWIISWSLCGIQELGQVIEHPFDGAQSLRLAVMANTVHASNTDALTMVASQSEPPEGLLRRAMRLELGSGFRPVADSPDLRMVDAVLGRTVLHHSAYVGDLSSVQKLVEAGAELSARDTWDGSTPLDVARGRNHVEVAR
ncbi:unnamed protein product, partial [Prorocentrum cordatum]